MPELIIHDGHKCAYLGDHQIILTSREYDILLCLGKANGNVVSKSELARQIYQSQYLDSMDERAIVQLVSRLRHKIATNRYGQFTNYSSGNSYARSHLATRVGAGYYLENARVVYANEVHPPSSSTEKDGNATHAVPASTSPSEAPLTTPFAPSVPTSARLRLFLLQKGFTRRERQIVMLLINDEEMTHASDYELAQELEVKRGTIKKHLGSIYRKLGVNRRCDAIRVVLQVMYGGGAA